jgi:hypothetical protein
MESLLSKTIVEYDIVTALSARDIPGGMVCLQAGDKLTPTHPKKGLTTLVNLKIKEGWSPLGGPWCAQGYYSQAIVKYDS